MCATQYIERLPQAGTPVEYLQDCLLGAIESASNGLIQLLLATGVSITLLIIKPVLEANNKRVLSLFLEDGWDLRPGLFTTLALVSCCVTQFTNLAPKPGLHFGYYK